MAKVDYQYAIDTPRSTRNGGTVFLGGGGGSSGGGSVDLSLYLKRDGSVPMTGNLDMGDFSIINVSLVDGVDIPAHVANINAHHNKVHVLANQADLGDDHTIVGSIGQVLRVYATNKARFEQLNHTDLANVLPDQHHARKHNVTSTSDHEASGTSTYDLFGIPGSANVLGWLTPSSAPTGVSILRSDNGGGLTLQELRISSAFTLMSGGNVSVGPDIQFYSAGLVAAETDLNLNFGSNGAGAGSLYIRKNTDTSAGTLVARFDFNGNLGLGMSAGASYRLDVTGSARISDTTQSSIFVATTKNTTPLIDSASGSVTVSPFNSTLVVNNKVRVQNIDTATGQSLTIFPADSIILSPGDNRVVLENGKALRTDVFVSGFAGSGFHLDQGILRTGKTTFEVDDLTVRGRMSVYELLIRQIRATNGSLFVSSTARVKRVDIISGGYRLWTTTADETPTNATEHAHGFLPGDIIRAQRTRWNGTQFVGVYQSDLRVTAMDATLSSFRVVLVDGDIPTPGMEFVRLGNQTDTTRQGVIYLTSDDTASPFIDIVNGVTSHTDWNGTGFVKARLGLLTGITSTTNEYGLIAGNGIFDPTDVNAKYIRASNEGVFLYGAGLKMYKGGQQTVNLGNDGTMWLGPSSSNKIFEFDGNVLNLRGALLIGPQIPNAGFATDAILYCAYDGSWDSGNDSGNATGHLGQQETFSDSTQKPQFRKGKFGKAIEAVEAQTTTTLNSVVNSSFERGTIDGNPENFSGAVGNFASYVNGAVNTGTSSVTLSEDMSYDGKRSYKIVRKGASPASTNYGFQYRWNVTSGATYSIQVKVFVAKVVNPTSSSNVYLLVQDNVTSLSVNYSGGLTGDWVTLKLKTTATATGVARVFVYSDNCDEAIIYVDALQITQTGYHLPYYCPKETTPGVFETTRAGIHTRYLNQYMNFNGLSVSTWFRLEDKSSIVGRTLRVFEIIGLNSSRVNLTISTDDKPTVFYASNGVNSSIPNGSSPTIESDVWHHAVATFENGTAKMYINGVFAASASYDSPIVGPVEVRVGAYASNQQLNGWIDDFAIIPRALTAEEVSQIYSSNAPLRILSSAFELQLMKVNTVGVTNTIVGNGSGLFASTTNATQTIASFALINDNVSSWGGFTSLKAGDVIIGDSAGQYLKFKREDGTMILNGQLIITGASGYANFADKPTNLADINSSEGAKLTGIAAGATVGADWDTNLGDIPIRFGNAPVGGTAGLYLTPTHLGYYDGSAWKMWMSSAGQFYFGGDSGARIQWNGSVLAGYNSSNIMQWSASSTTGLFTAGAGAVEIGANGQLFYTNSITINDFAEPSLNYPNITPNIAQRVKWRDTAAGPWTGSTGTKNYNGNEVLRLYVSSQHFISGTNEGFWEHYIDGVLETPSISTPSTSGSYYRRLWLKSPTIVLDGDIQITGNLIQTSSAIQIKTITGSLWQAVSMGNLTVNGELGVSGNISGSNLFLNGSIISASAVGFTTSGGAASIPVYAKQYMASSDFSHSIRIPTNGIYSLGGVSIGRATTPDINYILDVLGNTRLTGALAVTGAASVASLSSSGAISGASVASSSGNIFTASGFTAPKLTSTPTLTDGVCMIYFKETSGFTRIVFSYREGATTYYYYNNIEDMSGGWIHSTTAP